MQSIILFLTHPVVILILFWSVLILIILIGTLVFVASKKFSTLKKTIAYHTNRIDNILEATKTGFWERDIKHDKLIVSDSFKSLFENTIHDYSNFDLNMWVNLIHPEDRGVYDDEFEQLVQNHTDFIEVECRIKDKDHLIKWYRIHAKTTERFDDGRPSFVVGLISDITSERMSEKQKEHSNYLLKHVIENSNGGLAIFDNQMNYLYVSEMYKKQFRLSYDPTGMNHYDVFPDLPQKFKDAHARALSGESIEASKDDYLRSSGEQLYSSWSLKPWLDIEGNIGGIISYVQLITNEVEKEMKLAYMASHDMLTGIFNRSYFNEFLANNDNENHWPIGIMLIDLNGMKLINDAYGINDGDEVIKMVASHLKQCSESCGALFRIGGDEFAFVSFNVNDDIMKKCIQQAHQKISELYYKNIQLSVSIGYAIKFDQCIKIEDVFKEAERDLYKRKLLDTSSIRNNAISGILQTLTDKYEVEKAHFNRVQKLCLMLGKQLKLSKEDMDELSYAAILHDIGKIAIPDAILNKPTRLDSEEYEIMKTHTTKGYEILKAADEYSDIARYALTHHEKYDGTGYPHGFAGEEIPLFSRIISICDAYEAMTADRPYRMAQSVEYAINELRRCSGTQFDPWLVDVFIEHVIPIELNENKSQ